MAMAAKASLISARSMERMSQPARCKACLTAGTGPNPNMPGSTAAMPYETRRAVGTRPRLSAHVPSASTMAAAASFSPGALPAVMVPFGRNAGLSRARSIDGPPTSIISTASASVTPFLPETSTATICDLKLPSACAAAKRCCDRKAQRSCASRVTWCFSARSSVCQPECASEKASFKPSRNTLS